MSAVGIGLGIAANSRVRALERALEVRQISCDLNDGTLRVANHSDYPIFKLRVIRATKEIDGLSLARLEANADYEFDTSPLGSRELEQLEAMFSGAETTVESGGDNPLVVLFHDYRSRSWELHPGFPATRVGPWRIRMRSLVAKLDPILIFGSRRALRQTLGMDWTE